MTTSVCRLSLVAMLLIVSFSTFAQGILFSEKRIILKNQGIYTLQVCNPTEEARTFQLSIIDKTVDVHHKLVDIPDSVTFANSLKNEVRIFPKRITLPPGECQEVQLQLRGAGILTDGEYRSYLHFLPLLTQAEITPDSLKAKKNDAPSFDIIIRIGAAIPLIYRKNAALENVAIDSVSLVRNDKQEPTAISLYIHRKGNRSTYGSIAVFSGEKNELVTTYPPIAIYPEVVGRRVNIPIAKEKLVASPNGQYMFKIVYINEEDKQREDVLCEWTGEVR
ncbi:hypothetical protein [Bacteroides sp.]|uniref:hypothetical protein n=1 Tax=Bacteroides sp. TaxID=29523 RepID=UPI00260E1810|nr:hypothetical protein [Bacteroides sp.]MDD3037383.1 hypothetical protein [Bacteroides sp.]